MMFFPIPTKGHFMTTIEKRSFSIKTKCPRKILNSIVLVLIFGNFSQSGALKDLTMIRLAFLLFIEMFSKKLKLNNSKPLNQEKTSKKK